MVSPTSPDGTTVPGATTALAATIPRDCTTAPSKTLEFMPMNPSFPTEHPWRNAWCPVRKNRTVTRGKSQHLSGNRRKVEVDIEMGKDVPQGISQPVTTQTDKRKTRTMPSTVQGDHGRKRLSKLSREKGVTGARGPKCGHYKTHQWSHSPQWLPLAVQLSRWSWCLARCCMLQHRWDPGLL